MEQPSHLVRPSQRCSLCAHALCALRAASVGRAALPRKGGFAKAPTPCLALALPFYPPTAPNWPRAALHQRSCRSWARHAGNLLFGRNKAIRTMHPGIPAQPLDTLQMGFTGHCLPSPYSCCRWPMPTSRPSSVLRSRGSTSLPAAEPWCDRSLSSKAPAFIQGPLRGRCLAPWPPRGRTGGGAGAKLQPAGSPTPPWPSVFYSRALQP